MEIRHGRMTREEGIQLVKKYDYVRPKTLDIYLKFQAVDFPYATLKINQILIKPLY